MHPVVVSVIPGAITPDEVRGNVASMRTPIPAQLWSDLKSEGLLRADAVVAGRQPARGASEIAG